MSTHYIDPTSDDQRRWQDDARCIYCGSLRLSTISDCFCRYCDSCSRAWISDTIADYHKGEYGPDGPRWAECPECREEKEAA